MDAYSESYLQSFARQNGCSKTTILKIKKILFKYPNGKLLSNKLKSLNDLKLNDICNTISNLSFQGYIKYIYGTLLLQMSVNKKIKSILKD